MNIEAIIQKVTATHSGLVQNTHWGEVGLFYNPENKLAKGIYVLTFKGKDGKNDTSSNLTQRKVFRLSLGISKTTFKNLFGEIPSRPNAGGVVKMPYDFSTLDTIMPHPIYGWMSWICVINPSKSTYKKLEPLIREGYQLAQEKYIRKKVGRGY